MVPAMPPRQQAPTSPFTFSPTRRGAIEDAAYWLDRAEEVQTIAEGMTHPETRSRMLGLAHTYKVMAERAYLRAKNET
jgi:hypothetical protein